MQSNQIRRHSRYRRRGAVAAAALLTTATVGAVIAPTAGHATGPTTQTRLKQQCVIAAEGGASAQRCFATSAEAIAYGSGGQIRMAANATTHDAVIALRAHDAAAARGVVKRSVLVSNIIGIEYDGSYRSGAAKYFSVSGDCYSGATYGFPRLSTYGWNDRINSAQTFVGCVGQHYDDTNYSDTRVSVFGTRDDFGGQNNKTSSIRFV
jgi:hypothetical protein